MKELIIKIDKDAIMQEVSLASSYAAAKLENVDKSMYERIAAVDSDAVIISRFWTEACGEISENLKDFIVVEVLTADHYEITLQLSNAYDETLNKSVESDLFSSLSAAITGKWFRYVYASRAEEWLMESKALLNRAARKLCHRVAPRRRG